MGCQVNLELKSTFLDDTDEEGPIAFSDFMYDICNGFAWQKQKHKSFLCIEESNLLSPNYWDDNDLHLSNEALRDPKELKKVLLKIKKYLKENAGNLPYEIIIDSEKMKENNLEFNQSLNGEHFCINGDSEYNNIDTHFTINVSTGNDNRAEILFELKDKIEVQGKIYYLKKETRFERHKYLRFFHILL